LPPPPPTSKHGREAGACLLLSLHPELYARHAMSELPSPMLLLVRCPRTLELPLPRIERWRRPQSWRNRGSCAPPPRALRPRRPELCSPTVAWSSGLPLHSRMGTRPAAGRVGMRPAAWATSGAWRSSRRGCSKLPPPPLRARGAARCRQIESGSRGREQNRGLKEVAH
jgi:hypothetical protein